MTNYYRVEPTHEIGARDRARMRIGDVIVLSYFDHSTENAEVIALGLIRQVQSERLVISWRPASFTLFPSPWGIPKWRTMPVFKFAKSRVEHYRLADHVKACHIAQEAVA